MPGILSSVVGLPAVLTCLTAAVSVLGLCGVSCGAGHAPENEGLPGEMPEVAPTASTSVPDSSGIITEPAPEMIDFEVLGADASARLAGFLWAAADPAAAAQEVVEQMALDGSTLWSRTVTESVVRWMLEQPASRDGVRAFYSLWLGIDQLSEVEKEASLQLDDDLRASLQREAPAFGVHETLDTAGTLNSLLLSPYTFVDERLAAHYGLTGDFGSTPEQVDFPESSRRGILSGAGVITIYSSVPARSWPAKRSWAVLEPLLCVPISTGLPMPAVAPAASRSVKEQMMAVTAEEPCATCHQLLNSIGFGLIGFDSLGRWDPALSFSAEETRGWVPALALSDAPTFNDWGDLMQQLSVREEVRNCFAEQWLRYGSGVRTDLFRGAPEIPEAIQQRVVAGFEKSDWSLRELVVVVALEVAQGLP